MPNYYIDPVSGNDSTGDGTRLNPWKTLTSGATAVRIAPGDEIRIKKSADPVSLAIDATFTDNSETVTLASVLTTTIDNCETAWTGKTEITATRTTTAKVEGSYCANLVIGANFTTGLAATFDFSSIDISGFTHISGLIKSTINLSANDLAIVLDDTAVCASPVETINIPEAIKANTWMPFVIPIATPANCTAIISIGINVNVDRGACVINLDNIVACNLSLTHRTLIGLNDTYWWPIRSISGTTIKLGDIYGTTDKKYAGAGGTATGYTQIPTPMVNIGTDEWQLMDSGNSYASLITIKGGWDFSATDAQNGHTFLDGLQCAGAVGGFYSNTKNFFYLDRLNFVRCLYGFYLLYNKGFEMLTCGGIGCAANGLAMTHTSSTESHYNKLNTFKALQNNGTGIYISNSGNEPLNLISIESHGNGSHGVQIASTYSSTIGKTLKAWSNAAYGINTTGSHRIDTIDTKNNISGGVFHGSGAVDSVWLHNFTSGEATKIYFNSPPAKGSWPLKSFLCTKYLGVEGDDRIFYRYGTISRDTSNQDAGVACMSLTPNTANLKLVGEIFGIAVTASTLYTATIRIKKTADYNGNNPRICWFQNGIYQTVWTVKTVTTSYADYTCDYTPGETGFAGLLVDCDGTVGSIYIDTVSIS